ncbi:hypothetical protein D3C78_1249520 [compost metagenome]
MKSLTYIEPQAADMVLLIAAMLTCRARAFSSSMLTLNCGSSSLPLGRTRVSFGCWLASIRNWLRASISVAWPTPELSCRNRSKPMALPISRIAGGTKAITVASLIWAKRALARWARLKTSSPAPVRSLQSLSMISVRPEFWPRPAKLKPLTVSTWLVSWPSSCCR